MLGQNERISDSYNYTRRPGYAGPIWMIFKASADALMIFSVFQKNRVFWYSWSTRKPHFPIDLRPLVKGRIANFCIFLDIFELLRFG